MTYIMLLNTVAVLFVLKGTNTWTEEIVAGFFSRKENTCFKATNTKLYILRQLAPCVKVAMLVLK